MQRREFLKSVGLGALAVGAAPNALKLSTVQSNIGRSIEAAAETATTADPIWRVLNRLTNGPRPGQVAAVKKMGLQAFIDHQLAPDKIDDSASEQRLSDFASLNMSASEAAYLLNDTPAVNELNAATVARALYSERQLYEVMTNFWSEHFSIWHYKEKDTVLKADDDHNVVRKHALGKFRDILGASARSPAMLVYLDNAKSNKAHPNENYGREVMELHTVTIGAYTETDVQEVARCFTGWTMQNGVGDFYFNKATHDDGAKTVLGHTIAAGGGQQDGETVLDILATHPDTALHIASKLCRRFIADDPPVSAVKAAQQAFLQSGGDIPTVLRVIFATPEFLNAPPRFKRPWEYVISLVRAVDGQPTDRLFGGVLNALRSLGQLPFDRITPDGYTDYASLWEANMLLRWNDAISVAYNRAPGIKVDLTGLLKAQGVPADMDAIIAYFAQHLYGRPLTQNESAVLSAFANKGGKPDLSKAPGQARAMDVIALMLAGPAFQWH